MSANITLLLRVLPVICLVLLGLLLQKFRFFAPQTIGDLKKIIVNISLPAMLFLSFAQTGFSTRYLGIVAAVFLTCLILLLLASLFARLCHIANPYFPALFGGFETGMIGYALFVAVFGKTEMFKLAIVDLGQVIFVFFVLVYFINRQNGAAATGRQLVMSFIKTPVILAILLGVLFSLTGLGPTLAGDGISGLAANVLGTLSNLTVPLITVVIGYELTLSRKALRGPLLTALVRILVLSGLAWLINTFLIGGLLGLDRMFQMALYILFLLPPPFVIPIMMQEKDPEQRQFVLNTLSVHLLLSIMAFLVVIVLV